ncbi:MAG: hypothetical protein HUJ59_05730, partial [Bacilli bacterium]|nr:hypothetical protein [Bacilli bacterium]
VALIENTFPELKRKGTSRNGKWEDQESLDKALTETCINSTFAEINMLRETTTSIKQGFLCDLLTDAMFSVKKKIGLWPDINLILTIVHRIDGTVPEEETRESYANLFGDALEEVMQLPDDKQSNPGFHEPILTALAKATIMIARAPAYNAGERKEKAAAVDLIFNRMEGRKSGPVKAQLEERYISADWRKKLEKGEKNDTEI